MIEYLLRVAACLAASYLFYHWLLRNEASIFSNRLFLLLMPLLSFLLPLAPLQSPFRSTTIYPETNFETAATPLVAAPSASPLALGSIVAIVYQAGAALLLLLRILFHLFHLYRLQRKRPRERLRNCVLVRIETPTPPFSFFNRIFCTSRRTPTSRKSSRSSHTNRCTSASTTLSTS